MAYLNIVKDGDETLRKTCHPVEKITPRIRRLIDDMIQTMHRANGVGLAAPQVGVLRRVAVIEVEEGEIYELINPAIVEASGKQNEAEGCLSVPGKWAITDRPMEVTVEALDREGNTVRYKGEGLLARAFCHEIDHLDGILFYDNAIEMLEPDEGDED